VSVADSLRRHHHLALATSLVWLALAAIGLARGAPLTIPYLVIVLGLAAVIVRSDDRVRYSTLTLTGLALWGTLHLAGGLIELDDGRILYNTSVTRLIHLDNAVHFLGFGAAGLAGFEALRAALTPKPATPLTPLTPRLAWAITTTAGLAAGAVNEVVEFAASHLLGATNIGGYENTGRDLVANLLGSLLAGWWASRREIREKVSIGDEAVRVVGEPGERPEPRHQEEPK
jgi:uncharacterized membrane protein